jgi:hypothetical protein
MRHESIARNVLDEEQKIYFDLQQLKWLWARSFAR